MGTMALANNCHTASPTFKQYVDERGRHAQNTTYCYLGGASGGSRSSTRESVPDTESGMRFGMAWASGVVRSFANTFSNSGGGFFGGLNNMDPQRRWRPQSALVFGGCNSTSPYDTNDGGGTPTVYASGTVNGCTIGPNKILGPETYVVTTSGSWGGANLNPVVSGAPYTFFDVTGSFGFEIQGFTTNTLTMYVGCQGTSCTGSGPPSRSPSDGR